MQNELFRELYDEAKGHEKNVSLNQLVAGSKEFVIYWFIISIRLIIYSIVFFKSKVKNYIKRQISTLYLQKCSMNSPNGLNIEHKNLDSKSLFIIYRFI